MLIQSLIKQDINFWNEDIQIKKSASQDFLQHIADKDVELSSAILKQDSEKVAYINAGYSAKKLIQRLKCSEGKTILIEADTEILYFQLLSRGG